MSKIKTANIDIVTDSEGNYEKLKMSWTEGGYEAGVEFSKGDLTYDFFMFNQFVFSRQDEGERYLVIFTKSFKDYLKENDEGYFFKYLDETGLEFLSTDAVQGMTPEKLSGHVMVILKDSIATMEDLVGHCVALSEESINED